MSWREPASPLQKRPHPRQTTQTPWICAAGYDWSELIGDNPCKTVPAKTVLWQQGDAADHVFVIVKGLARLDCCHDEGSLRTLYLMSSGVILGEGSAMLGGFHKYRALTMSECRLYRISAQVFQDGIARSPSLAAQVLSVVTQKKLALLHIIDQDGLLGVQSKLAQFFYHLAGEYGQAEPSGVYIPLRLTHQEIADALNLCRVTVTNYLLRFAQKGVLERCGKGFLLRDVEALGTLMNAGCSAEPQDE